MRLTAPPMPPMPAQTPIIRAIDVGYGYTKYTNNQAGFPFYGCDSFPSVAAKIFPLSATISWGSSGVYSVPAGGQRYLVGPKVLISSDFPLERKEPSKDYALSTEYEALLKGALASIGQPAIDALALGAPVVDYDATKNALKERFTGTIDVGDRQVHVKQVVVLPQPFGGWAWYGATLGKHAELLSLTTLVIDPGYHTIDWLVMRGDNLVKDRSGSRREGMHETLSLLSKHLFRATRTELVLADALEDVDKAVRSGHSIRHGDQVIDPDVYKQVIGAHIERNVAAIFKSVRSLIDIDQVIVVGGAGELYADYLRPRIGSTPMTVLNASRYANVRGFHYFAERVWKIRK